MKDCAKHRFRIYKLIFHMCVLCVCSGVTILQQNTSNTFYITIKDSVFVFVISGLNTNNEQVKCTLFVENIHQFDYHRSTSYSQVAKLFPPSESKISGKLIRVLAGKILGRRYLLKSYMFAALLVSLSFEEMLIKVKEIIVEKE